MKFIDPEQRETWQHPDEPGTYIEYRAYAGAMLTVDVNAVARQYINYGITKVVNKGEAVIEPQNGWASILPSDIQTTMFPRICRLSKLTPEEEQDSPQPPGSQSTPKLTSAKGASGKTGNAPSKVTTGKKHGKK